jgi:hypothetical protein
MPKLPLLPVWEKGVGGMRGKGARECRTSLISPKNSTLEGGMPAPSVLAQTERPFSLRCGSGALRIHHTVTSHAA